MENFPDHPIIAAMERDGQLRERKGWTCRCAACSAAVYPGEIIYRVGDKIFCEDHSREALKEATDYA